MAKKKEEVVPVKKIEEPKLSLKERMARAAAPAKAAPVAASKKKEKPKVILTGEDADVLDRMCAFKQVMELAEGHFSVSQDLLRPILEEKTLRAWATSGNRQENVEFVSKDSATLFVAVDRSSSFKLPGNADGTPKTLEQFLTEQGVSADIIEKIKATEVEEKEVQVVAQPDDIEKTDPVLADKMREAILGALTDDELAKVLSNKMEVKIKSGFLGRIPSICKNATKNEEEAYQALKKVLDATRVYTSAIKNPTTHKLKDALETVSKGERADADKEETFELVDKSYKLIAKGNKMMIYGDGKLLGTKDCTDFPHAVNSARKLKTKEAVETILDELN